MILQHVSSIWSATAPAVANHLWQSTLFAVFAGLLTLLLRKEQANARYWLWLVSSLKFLFPFELLVSLGSVFVVPSFHAGCQAAAVVVMEQVSQPFVRPAAMVAQSVPPSVSVSGFSQLLPALLVATWLGGFLTVLLTWWVRWRRMSRVLCGATPSVKGKEAEVLRRLERLAGVQKHIPIFLSSAAVEPGIFGVLHPVLILPKGICDRLNEKHLQAVLAHEVWHVRRRDNLAAAVHMLVQAVFWFHPLVWWLGSRLVEERERSCDEQVLRLGNPPNVYAESILKTCELFVESPVACASGITGANLKKRIVRIMAGETRHKLSWRKKLLVGVTGFLALAVPLGLGLAGGSQRQTGALQSQASSVAGSLHVSKERFEVASIKPDHSGSMLRRFTMRPGRFTATNIPISMVIKYAFNLQSNDQLSGGPGWINSEKYDIEGKEFDSFVKSMKGHPWEDAQEHMRRMVQSMLADRFNLKIHLATKELPVYVLVVANHGPKLAETKLLPLPRIGNKPSALIGDGTTANPKFRGIGLMGVGHLEGNAATTELLTDALTHELGRLVVNDTGLKGQYDFTLKWTPDQEKRTIFMEATGGKPSMGKPAPADPSGPSIFTAIQEQLGLKLKAEKIPVGVIVIDHIDRPSPN